MMKTSTRRNTIHSLAACVVLLLFQASSPPAVKADVTYSDGDWGSQWSLEEQYYQGPANGGGSTETATTIANNGNPGSYYQQTATIPTAPPGVRNGIDNEYLFSGASGANGYNPSVSGEILSLDFCIDIINFTQGLNVSAAPMLEQGGMFYRATVLTSMSPSWTTLSYVGLTALNFGLVSNDPSGIGSTVDFSMHPDFSLTGGPISFGFASVHSTSLGGVGYTKMEGFDNWCITLHTVPEPASLSLVLLGALATTLWARRFRRRHV
jgi:PEP-CTERM motif